MRRWVHHMAAGLELGLVRGRPLEIDEETAQRIRGLAAESHLLEATVRQAILEQLLTQGGQVVGSREILDLAEGFAWVTNPGQAHGGRT